MKIRISNIPEEGVHFEFARKGSWLEELLPADKRTDFKLREVRVDCRAAKIRETIRLDMAMDAVFELECCRCLDPVVLSCRSEVKYTLAPLKERMEKEDPESLEEDLNFSYYKGDEIEFDPIVVEQILMQIPLKPLCREDCKGLCPSCGINLNTDACKCGGETGHPGFAALKKFVVHKKK